MEDFTGWIGAALAILIAVAILAVYVYSLWELAFRRSDLSTLERIVWALVLLFGNGIGLVAYLIIGRRKKPTPAD